jgi:hypothetical protein
MFGKYNGFVSKERVIEVIGAPFLNLSASCSFDNHT